jgi:preprotein translocase subunit SecA
VLDEKWKDHLYDLDQLRNAIHYRSWGQKDPLLEYKQEAYTMFVDLMGDIHDTFTDRFLKAQLVFGPPPSQGETRGANGDGSAPRGPGAPTKRYNALGVLEDIPAEQPSGTQEVLDIGPDQPPSPNVRARQDPTVVGAGRVRSLQQPAVNQADIDWSTVGRNDPCPCGSGKKFKKCHGATL